MIEGREKSQIGWKNPPLINSRLWGLLLVIGPNIQHCRVFFAAREYAAGDNDRRLDGQLCKLLRSLRQTTQTARCAVCSTTTMATHMQPSCLLQPELELKVINNLNSSQFQMSTFNTKLVNDSI